MKTIKSIKAVQCVYCHKLHLSESTEFVTIQGNIGVGNCQDFILNGNIDDEGKIINSSVYCRRCIILLLVNKPTAIDIDL